MSLTLPLLFVLIIMGKGAAFTMPVAMIFIVCSLWLLIRKKDYLREDKTPSRSLALFFACGFFVLLIISILVLYERPDEYKRPLLFFISSTAMAGVLAGEIVLSSRRMRGLILGQIFVLAVLFAWSQMTMFPNVLGIDPWYHQWFTSQIVDSGHILGGRVYSQLPIFHILAGSAQIIGNVDYKSATMGTIVIAQLFSEILLIYLIARELFGNHKISLLSALAGSFASYSIHMSYWPIPMSLAFTFTLMALYLILKGYVKDIKIAALLYFFLITLVLTHSITAISMSLVLVIAYAVPYLRWTAPKQSGRFVTFSVVAFFLVITFAWWSYASGVGAQLAEFLRFGFSNDYFMPGTRPVQSKIPVLETVVNYSGLFLFFSIAILGVFHSISRKGTLKGTVVGVIGLCFLLIGFLAIVGNLFLLEDRWWFYGQIALAIPLGAALFIISNLVGRRPVVKATLVTACVFFLALVTIISPFANVDNPILSPHSSTRDGYTQSELNGAGFVASKGHLGIATDVDFGRDPLNNYFGISFNDVSFFDISIVNGTFTNGRLLVVRDLVSSEPFRLNGPGEPYRVDYDLNNRLASSSLSKIYTSDGLSSYQ
jgi:hypothetical protein